MEQELAQRNNALLKLNRFALELSNLPSDSDVEALIANQVKDFACADVAVFSEYDSLNRTTTAKHIVMDSGLLEKVVGLLGKQIQGIHSAVSDEMYREMTTEIIGIKKTLYEASFGAIPRSVGAAIQALLKVDRIIGLAYITEGKLYGTSILLMGKGQPDPPKALLENYIHLAASSLRRRQAEIALTKAKEKAEESDRLKSAFLTNMSHEIRTPMNGIIGFTELLKEPLLTVEEKNDFIQTIQISGARMLNTINSIVDISKIESGLISVDIKETNLNEKMEFTYKFFKPEVESKGLQFLFKTSLPTNEAIINTDNEKVYGILTNLVRNAIKFTFEGSIEFGYEKKDEYLEFFVKDTGVGIPENQKELIFERFRQGSESHNRGYEGSGLGLSISKSYVEMLGGKIWVESEEEKGSIFYFTIPYNPASVEIHTIENIVFTEKRK
jgi:signal transduction histidine kinase